MSCCSASTSTVRPCSSAVADGDRADRDDPRARRRPHARLEQEADGRARGEGHVGGPVEAGALRVGERLGDRVVQRDVVDLERHARATHRAARSAPRRLARRARAARRARHPPAPRRAPPPRSARARCPRECRVRAAPPRCPARWLPRWPRRGARGVAVRRIAAERVEEQVHAVRTREADQGVFADPSIAARRSPSTGRGSIRIAGRLDHLGAELAQSPGQAARLRARARDGDHLAVERARAPAMRSSRAARLPARPRDRRRRGSPRPPRARRFRRACRPRCADRGSVPRSITAAASLGSRPAAGQPLRDQRQPLDPHVEDERPGEASQGVPVECRTRASPDPRVP